MSLVFAAPLTAITTRQASQQTHHHKYKCFHYLEQHNNNNNMFSHRKTLTIHNTITKTTNTSSQICMFLQSWITQKQQQKTHIFLIRGKSMLLWCLCVLLCCFISLSNGSPMLSRIGTATFVCLRHYQRVAPRLLQWSRGMLSLSALLCSSSNKSFNRFLQFSPLSRGLSKHL